MLESTPIRLEIFSIFKFQAPGQVPSQGPAQNLKMKDIERHYYQARQNPTNKLFQAGNKLVTQKFPLSICSECHKEGPGESLVEIHYKHTDHHCHAQFVVLSFCSSLLKALNSPLS